VIYGVGVDLVKISRIKDALDRFGERFARRILTDHELASYAASSRQSEFLAKHFAAKEALLKALGTGLRMGIKWHHMEVRNNSLGKPYLLCSGRIQELFDEYGVGDSFISITDEHDYAAAFVTLQRR
jgi:holo-[acyl-carrier protein] synthase